MSTSVINVAIRHRTNPAAVSSTPSMIAAKKTNPPHVRVEHMLKFVGKPAYKNRVPIE
jgi:hypothetical protein